jgi:mono/diheme cytochrome c family protein
MKQVKKFLFIMMVVMMALSMTAGVGALNFEESVENGKALYAKNCASCHGAEGEGGAGPAVNEKSKLDALGLENFKHSVEDGVEGTAMPPWKDVLTDEEIDDVVHFIYAEWADFIVVGLEMWPWEITFVVMGIIWTLMGMYYVIRV